MGMSADKDIGMEFINEFPGTDIIASGIAPYMDHQHLESLAFKESVHRMNESELMVVAVAGNAKKRLEGSHLLGKSKAATEVAGMPDLVHRFKEAAEFGAEDTVGVGYETYI